MGGGSGAAEGDGYKGVERNTITYNAAISACAKGGQWEEALGLLSEMASKGVERNIITYSAAISACEEAGVVRQCDALYAEAYSAGLLDHRLESSPIDIDLHYLPASVARAAVRFVLANLRRTASSSLLMKDLYVVTGSHSSPRPFPSNAISSQLRSALI